MKTKTRSNDREDEHVTLDDRKTKRLRRGPMDETLAASRSAPFV